jgi:hypothetical protein
MEFTLHRQRSDAISHAQLFEEMERIWHKLGHRPSRTEWEASDAKFSYTTYKRKFGGWVSACIQFIEFKMGSTFTSPVEDMRSAAEPSLVVTAEAKRDVPLKLRLKILERDNFTCVLCGKSPALVPGTILHIDHVTPFSKGGKTVAGNLRTLCSLCNLGRGNCAELAAG